MSEIKSTRGRGVPSCRGVRSLTSLIVFVVGFLGVGFCLMSVAGCAPRGETKSVDEVLLIAKRRYDLSVVESKVSSATREELLNLAKDLNAFISVESPGELSTLAGGIGEQLARLTPLAGYTTRPALGELGKTYRGFAGDESVGVSGESAAEDSKQARGLDASARKLLVSRSFTALAQELETTSFLVQ